MSSQRLRTRFLRVGITAAVASAAMLAASLGTAERAHAVDVQPAFPIRATFYYPWFPEAWTQHNIYPYSKYTPSLGYYDGSDPAVIQSHIASMRYGGMNAGIASWWGKATPTDGRIAALLSAAASTPFRWALYYEKEGTSNPSASLIRSNLDYIYQQYALAPAYLRVNGRPVLFVYGGGRDTCAMADRWAQANADHRFYVVLKVIAGYRACANQPDSWHQYSPAVARDSQTGFSYSISPGFFKKGAVKPRLVRDPVRWDTDIAAMVASNAPWQLVTTFNEWGEGTAVESGTKWPSLSGQGTYLDSLHAVLGST